MILKNSFREKGNMDTFMKLQEKINCDRTVVNQWGSIKHQILPNQQNGNN